MLDKKLTGNNNGDKPTIDQSPLHSRLNDNLQDKPQLPVNDKAIEEQDSDGSGDAFSATEQVRE